MTDEEWRPLPDWSGYEISNLGRVRSLPRWGTQGGVRETWLTGPRNGPKALVCCVYQRGQGFIVDVGDAQMRAFGHCTLEELRPPAAPRDRVKHPPLPLPPRPRSTWAARFPDRCMRRDCLRRMDEGEVMTLVGHGMWVCDKCLGEEAAS